MPSSLTGPLSVRSSNLFSLTKMSTEKNKKKNRKVEITIDHHRLLRLDFISRAHLRFSYCTCRYIFYASSTTSSCALVSSSKPRPNLYVGIYYKCLPESEFILGICIAFISCSCQVRANNGSVKKRYVEADGRRLPTSESNRN